MPWALVVEGEAVTRMADFVQAALMLDPLEAPKRRRVRPRAWAPVGRPQRVLRERVLDVGEDQLLVLLLVVDAQLEQAPGLRIHAIRGERLEYGFVDVRAVRADLGDIRAREEAAPRPVVVVGARC